MKFPRLIIIACGILGAGSLVGCKPPPSDVGTGPCFLVKKNPDGGTTPTRVTMGEVTAGKDFISFGSTECDDYVCVRDKDMPRAGDPSTYATGYCSHPCVPANSTGCAASREAAQFDPRSLTCRPMLLDPDTIAALCKVDPAKCEEVFGPNRSPYFCARAGVPGADGGTP